MTFADLDEVCRLENESFPVPWTRNLFEQELQQPEKTIYLVACSNERVIGYVGLSQALNEGHITTLAVDKDFHRRGIASTLILHVAAEALKRKMDVLTLEVRASNLTAQDLYRKFGFKIAGIRKSYYPESGEDAFIMTLKDITTLFEKRPYGKKPFDLRH